MTPSRSATPRTMAGHRLQGLPLEQGTTQFFGLAGTNLEDDERTIRSSRRNANAFWSMI